VFTWQVHGSYLYYLSHIRHELYVPVDPNRGSGYGGIGGPFPWPSNVHPVPVSDVAGLELDCILFQAADEYLYDQHEILSEEQRRLPFVYLEHDPPREHPTDTRHVVADDANITLVHVTPFNALMWDSGIADARVIEHGVTIPSDVQYHGNMTRGIAVVNHLARRGRRLGADVLETVRREVPVDLVGMASDESLGLREVPHDELPSFISRYRFFFNPIRYTSLGLAVCEAMMVGMPVIGLATTEMVTTIESGVSGYIHTDPAVLIGHMRRLLSDPAEARALGQGARKVALERFGIGRFACDWNRLIEEVCGRKDRSLPPALTGASR
jgi:glycosyltransferase involved in cell wall biosynthesis